MRSSDWSSDVCSSDLEGCRYATTPQSNARFWLEKFGRNVARDRKVMTELVELGWDPLVIWECETRDATVLRERIASHLGPARGRRSQARRVGNEGVRRVRTGGSQ